jgi:hypothetical protein
MASASRRNFQIVSCVMFLGGEAMGSEDALAPARADELRSRRRPKSRRGGGGDQVGETCGIEFVSGSVVEAGNESGER